MDVKNASGAELAAPAVYVIDGTGAQRDGTVVDADLDRGRAERDVRGDVPGSGHEGVRSALVILLFGDSNYGAFSLRCRLA